MRGTRMRGASSHAPRVSIAVFTAGHRLLYACLRAKEMLARLDASGHPVAQLVATLGLQPRKGRERQQEIHLADGTPLRARALRIRDTTILLLEEVEAWPTPSGSPELTPREREIVDLLMGGISNKDIACRLGLSVSTIKVHLNHVYAKTGAGSRAELMARVIGRRPARRRS